MLKLMKYEFRKQMFSKMIIAIILGVLTLYFGVMTVMNKSDNAAVSLALMLFTTLIATFYVSVESLTVYEKDLKTKQSYMLFLVPQSPYKILGAKLIAAILQIFFTLAICAATFAVCGAIYVMKYSNVKAFLDLVKRFVEVALEIKIDTSLLIRILVTMFVLWVFIVILGIFAETVVHTVLTKGKILTFLAAVMYVFIFWGVSKLDSVVYDSMIAANMAKELADIIEIVYYIVIDAALYITSAWLIDKRLSV